MYILINNKFISLLIFYEVLLNKMSVKIIQVFMLM